MTDTPKPPKRRRRKVIVALVLVSLASWWYWPRGDARFVGTWEWWPAGMGIEPVGFGQFHFEQNGTGLMSDRYTQMEGKFRWTTHLNRIDLVFGAGAGENRGYTFEFLTPDRLRFRHVNESFYVKLVRLPE